MFFLFTNIFLLDIVIIAERLKQYQQSQGIIMTTPTTKKNGGARPGAGRPKHGKNRKTIEREEALRQFRERVQNSTEHLLNAQMGLAIGSQILMKIPEGAKRPVRVTDEEEIIDYLDGRLGDGETYYFMTLKDPDNKAIDSLLNRTYGRPQESLDITSGGEPITTIEVVLDHGENTD